MDAVKKEFCREPPCCFQWRHAINDQLSSQGPVTFPKHKSSFKCLLKLIINLSKRKQKFLLSIVGGILERIFWFLSKT